MGFGRRCTDFIHLMSIYGRQGSNKPNEDNKRNNKMEAYIKNLLQVLVNKKRSGKIDYIIQFSEDTEFTEIVDFELLQFPQSVIVFYNVVERLNINKPRFFEILPISEMKLLNGKLLYFSIINSSEKICFDTEKINSAGEWDIVEYNNNYLITKTLSSYISNKLWAWVERDRKIWSEEIFE
jgi:hypothetical protein